MATKPLTIKLMTRRNLLMIAWIVFLILLLNRYARAFVPYIGLAFIIWAYVSITALKKKPALITGEKARFQAVIFMASYPILVQAFYYFRLKKVNPRAASAYGRLGWKVLGMQVVFGVAAILILLAFGVHYKL
jgi:hypothetical protein